MKFKLDKSVKWMVECWGTIEKEKEVWDYVEEDGEKVNKKVKKKYTLGLGFKKGKHFDLREEKDFIEVQIMHKPMLQIKQVSDTIRNGEISYKRKQKARADSAAIAAKQKASSNQE